jgi:3-hydroxyisobutyrate dehydrogenase-like beta-hydroxyacid dehydrogenase
MQVGIVGLGAMGRAVASNLVEAGVSTTVWNRSPAPLRELVAKGAFAANDVREVFQCDVILSLLFDDAAVRAVILESGVLASARAGIAHVCMSTISTGLARELVQAHEERGVHYVAAPVFGRPDVAAAAKLNIVTAGAPAILDSIEPVLGILGRTWRMGDDPQHGHLAKIAGNFMIGCAIETMAESAGLISSHGGDPSPFLAMMGETLFAAPIYRSYGAAIARGVFPGAPSGLQLPLKDVGLTLGEAKAANMLMPLAELLQTRLHDADRRGLADEDWSVALAKVAR